MKAATMCEFTRQEFIGGLQSIGVDSIEKFRAKLPSLRAELKDDSEFPFLKAKLDNVLLVGVRCGLFRLFCNVYKVCIHGKSVSFSLELVCGVK